MIERRAFSTHSPKRQLFQILSNSKYWIWLNEFSVLNRQTWLFALQYPSHCLALPTLHSSRMRHSKYALCYYCLFDWNLALNRDPSSLNYLLCDWTCDFKKEGHSNRCFRLQTTEGPGNKTHYNFDVYLCAHSNPWLLCCHLNKIN